MGASCSISTPTEPLCRWVQWLDDRNPRAAMPGYDTKECIIHNAFASFDCLVSGRPISFSELRNILLKAHNIRESEVMEIRITYKVNLTDGMLIDINPSSNLVQILNNDNYAFVFKVIRWADTSGNCK